MKKVFNLACVTLTVIAFLACSGDNKNPANPDSDTPSSSSEISSSSSNVKSSFGYPLKNSPTPSKGCGITSTLEPTKTHSNGTSKLYSFFSTNATREFYVDLPTNYDNNKPYKVLIGFHYMGSSAEAIATENGTIENPSPYYGQKVLDNEQNYIFVAPQGDGNGTWRQEEKDHIFFGEMLTKLEENFCIDTSRIFITGFSYGAMFANSLAQTFQHRVRAVVNYAVADVNVYLPENVGKPIAWMNVHGINDNIDKYEWFETSIKRILKNNGPEDTEGNFTDVSDELSQMDVYNKEMGSTHVCYDFKTVDPRFPVRACTWSGGHQWTAYDTGTGKDTWVPEDVHKFLEQF